MQNYESACPWDIYSLKVVDEMLDWQPAMAFDDMNDLHLRIARVTDDLRKIQQELNCAAMQAPSVAPVVTTSSTSTTRRSLARARAAKALATFCPRLRRSS